MLDTLYRKPWVGLLGLAIGFLTQPLGHTAYKVIEAASGGALYAVAFAVGVAGLAIVWHGLKQPELKATWMGLLGGWFVWIGWFEYSFKFFAELYTVPGYSVEPEVASGYVAAPQANMLQATVTIMAALFVIYGLFNLQTKCNLMRWLHRNLRFNPGMPTPDNHRSFARITAMEVLFVTWFCYQFWLYAIYLGTQGTGVLLVQGLYVLWTIWALYLVYKCTQQIRMAAALRYGVGAGIVLWGSAEMPAHFGAYREYWLYPLEYPIFNTIVTGVFAADCGSPRIVRCARLRAIRRAEFAIPDRVRHRHAGQLRRAESRQIVHARDIHEQGLELPAVLSNVPRGAFQHGVQVPFAEVSLQPPRARNGREIPARGSAPAAQRRARMLETFRNRGTASRRRRRKLLVDRKLQPSTARGLQQPVDDAANVKDQIERVPVALRQFLLGDRGRQTTRVRRRDLQQRVQSVAQHVRRQPRARRGDTDEVRQLVDVLSEHEVFAACDDGHGTDPASAQRVEPRRLFANVDRFEGDAVRAQKLLRPQATGAAGLPVHGERRVAHECALTPAPKARVDRKPNACRVRSTCAPTASTDGTLHRTAARARAPRARSGSGSYRARSRAAPRG
jgi:hypothetical protein